MPSERFQFSNWNYFCFKLKNYSKGRLMDEFRNEKLTRFLSCYNNPFKSNIFPNIRCSACYWSCECKSPQGSTSRLEASTVVALRWSQVTAGVFYKWKKLKNRLEKQPQLADVSEVQVRAKANDSPLINFKCKRPCRMSMYDGTRPKSCRR